MKRNYKAFISYRHLPLDMEYAKKIHTAIEHYVVPKDYRKNGEKKLGLVFRDKDELHISSNLSGELSETLDHSEFLIVVCSPKTKESVWVLEEISYFIETHDRNHVLVFLVDGDPAETIPRRLTEIYDEEGNCVGHVEPLAANITADTASERNKLFKVEKLRILASLIGCPFDTLYRREQRYRMRRITLSAIAVIAVSVGFIGILLNRNAEIEKQMTQAQSNESEVMAVFSGEALENGDYMTALDYALNALPKDDERPYVPSAEEALAEKLYLYSGGEYGYVNSISQETNVNILKISPNGEYIFTVDSYHTGRMFQAETAELLWEQPVSEYTISEKQVFFSGDEKSLVIGGFAGSYCLSVQHGTEIWNSENEIMAVSEDTTLFAAIDDKGYYVGRISDGTILHSIDVDNFDKNLVYDMDPVFSADNKKLVIGKWSLENADIRVWDVDRNYLQQLEFPKPQGNIFATAVCFSQENALVLGMECLEDTLPLYFYRYDNGWETDRQLELNRIRENDGFSAAGTYLDGMEFLQTAGDCIYLVSRSNLFLLDGNTGAVIKKAHLEKPFLDGKIMQDGRMVLVTKAGTFTLFDENGLSVNADKDSFKFNHSMSRGVIEGTEKANLTLVFSPDSAKNMCSVVRWKQSEYVKGHENSQVNDYFTHCFVSPSENSEVQIGYATERGQYVGVYTDAKGTKKEFQIPSEDSIDLRYNQNQCFLTDDGYLCINKRVVDLKADETVFQDNLELDLNAYSYIDKEVKQVVTMETGVYYEGDIMDEDEDRVGHIVLLTKRNFREDKMIEFDDFSDTEQRTGFAAVHAEMVTAGRSHYALVYLSSGRNQPYCHYACDVEGETWYALPSLGEDKVDVATFAEKNPFLAYVTSEHLIRVADVTGDKVVAEMDDGAYGADIVGLLFAKEDGLLIAMHVQGMISIFRTQTGELLYRNRPNDEIVQEISASSYVEAGISENQNRLILIIDNARYTVPVGHVIDLDSMKQTGCFCGFAHYYKETDTVLVNPPYGEAFVSPLFSFEEIREKGWELWRDSN